MKRMGLLVLIMLSLSVASLAREGDLNEWDRWDKWKNAYEHADYTVLSKGAEQNNYAALLFLGLMYEEGKGVEKDDFKAFLCYSKMYVWFRHPIHPLALYRMGMMDLEGRGVATKDTTIAVKRFREAAEQGYAPAQLELGILSLSGSGTIQHYGNAVMWFRKAAEQGLSDAQWRLGLLYQVGAGVEVDSIEAYKWYNISASQGDVNGTEYRSKISKYMTLSDIAKAQELTKKWIESRQSP